MVKCPICNQGEIERIDHNNLLRKFRLTKTENEPDIHFANLYCLKEDEVLERKECYGECSKCLSKFAGHNGGGVYLSRIVDIVNTTPIHNFEKQHSFVIDKSNLKYLIREEMNLKTTHHISLNSFTLEFDNTNERVQLKNNIKLYNNWNEKEIEDFPYNLKE